MADDTGAGYFGGSPETNPNLASPGDYSGSPETNPNLMPGPHEFTADQEKAMRVARAEKIAKGIGDIAKTTGTAMAQQPKPTNMLQPIAMPSMSAPALQLSPLKPIG